MPKEQKQSTVDTNSDLVTKSNLIALFAESKKHEQLTRNGEGKGGKVGKKRTGKYSWDANYGPGTDFATKQQLTEWVHKVPNSTDPVVKNNLIWKWCASCARWGSHSTAEHNPAKGKKRKAPTTATTNTSSTAFVAKKRRTIVESDGEAEFVFDDSDVENPSDHPSDKP